MSQTQTSLLIVLLLTLLAGHLAPHPTIHNVHNTLHLSYPAFSLVFFGIWMFKQGSHISVLDSLLRYIYTHSTA